MTKQTGSRPSSSKAKAGQGKAFLDTTMSLDRLIARPNDDVEWLHQCVNDLASWRKLHGLKGGKTNRDAKILEESFKTTGTVVMGRRTFDIGKGFWGNNPTFQVPCFVLSHDASEKVTKGVTTFAFVPSVSIV